MKVEVNKKRVLFLLRQYGLSIPDFLERISSGLSVQLTEADVFSAEVELNHLKRVDRLFEKGLNFYLDPTDVPATPQTSIFFRKDKFNTELNFAAKKVVNRFEEQLHRLTAYSILGGHSLSRKFRTYSVRDNAKEAAYALRREFSPVRRIGNDKKYLTHLIEKLAEKEVFVFEFVESPVLKEKANIDGFFLQPNLIVLKRQQKYLRREIFTLVHEIGHLLLDSEEVESIETSFFKASRLSDIEKWCNDFAFYFLAGEYVAFIDQLDVGSAENDYHHDVVRKIVMDTHLSSLAIFTRMLYRGKISKTVYGLIRDEIKTSVEDALNKEQERLRGIETEGRMMQQPKPINSPLFVSSLQRAYYNGLVSEHDMCKGLNIKPSKLSTLIE